MRVKMTRADLSRGRLGFGTKKPKAAWIKDDVSFVNHQSARHCGRRIMKMFITSFDADFIGMSCAMAGIGFSQTRPDKENAESSTRLRFGVTSSTPLRPCNTYFPRKRLSTRFSPVLSQAELRRIVIQQLG